jgi:hypothetical protein
LLGGSAGAADLLISGELFAAVVTKFCHFSLL